MGRSKTRQTGATLWISLAAILLFGMVGAFLVFFAGEEKVPLAQNWAEQGIIIDENCVAGPISEETADEADGEYGCLRYHINAAPWFANEEAAGSVLFQNSKNNCHFAKISYILDNGMIPYRSGLIPPDSHINDASLSVSLEKGRYTGICRIEICDMETLAVLGALEEKIVLTVAK